MGEKTNKGLGFTIAGIVLLLGGVAFWLFPKKTKPEPEPQPEPEVEKADEVIAKAYNNLLFESNKSVIKQQSLQSLDELAKYLIDNENFKLSLIGHTDSLGSDIFNKNLSINRAGAVKSYLVTKGVNASRISSDGKGESEPIEDNSTSEGRRKNRRVEFKIA
tara:strand:+ start:445 stop:930 length:486 start_codon:yes stop_codon:yes gene_type:complete